MRTYPNDIRTRVLRDMMGGTTQASVAARHGVSRSWVQRVWQRYRETGETAARSRGQRGKFRPDDEVRILRTLRRNPGITLRELRDRLELDISLTTLWRIVRRVKAAGTRLGSKSPH
jgi:transposase